MATPENYISTALTVDGSGTNEVLYLGDGLAFYVYGTWDSSNVTIESSADGTTYIAEADASAKTADFIWRAGANVPKGMVVRATLASAGGSTALTIRTFQGTTSAIGK
jgi:hypothetical protein